jgi:DNA-directed RNA polymerase II subunit RPB4
MSSSIPAPRRQPNGNGTAASSSSSSSVVVIENAADLSFGSEFEPKENDNVQILSNAQVAVILQMSAQNALLRDEELHEVYKKTQKYVNRFNTMKNAEKAHQELVDELDNLQNALTTYRLENSTTTHRNDNDDSTNNGGRRNNNNHQMEMELHGFEVAALMNLVATDTMVEEAVSLIPSLARFPDSAVDEILDLIRSTMIRIVSYGS